MEINEIALKLYKNSLVKQDLTLAILNVLSLVEKQDVEKVIEIYKKIVTKEIIVVDIKSTIKLSAKDKTKLENKITELFSSEIIFNYKVDKNFKEALEIKSEDKVIKFD